MIYDVLIIGGGPAGATAGLLLQQAGWSVAIIEKKIFPRRKVCGEFISATSLSLLQKLGLSDFYLAEGGPEIKRLGLFSGKNILTSIMPCANRSSGRWGRAWSREQLDNALLEKAKQEGVIVWQPWRVKSLNRQAKLFNITMISDGKIEYLSARIIIMANGSWEREIDTAQKYMQKSSDLFAFKAHFKNSDLDSDLMPLISFPGGYGGLVNSGNGRLTLSCCIRRDMLTTVRHQYAGSQAGEAVLSHIKATCIGVNDVLKYSNREDGWLSAGPIRPGIRKLYHNGIFFVGNIAGEAHPVVAEGISMALQSGWLLSKVLIKHKNAVLLYQDMKKAQLEYSNQWNKYFAHRIHVANIIAQLTMRPWVMRLTWPLLRLFPSILTHFAKVCGKTKQVVPLLP